MVVCAPAFHECVHHVLLCLGRPIAKVYGTVMRLGKPRLGLNSLDEQGIRHITAALSYAMSIEACLIPLAAKNVSWGIRHRAASMGLRIAFAFAAQGKCSVCDHEARCTGRCRSGGPPGCSEVDVVYGNTSHGKRSKRDDGCVRKHVQGIHFSPSEFRILLIASLGFVGACFPRSNRKCPRRIIGTT
jgi:hypothetical protein